MSRCSWQNQPFNKARHLEKFSIPWVLLDALNTTSRTRAEVLRMIAENKAFYDAEYNAAFVEMQYFGYLRRDPDAGGFNFWLTKLNNQGGDFRAAEMMKSFLVSSEYRQRFLTP